MSLVNIVIFKLFSYLFERGEGREKERERNVDVREASTGCLFHVPQLGTEPTI